MDPIIKAKWLAALRSGDYKQGRNMLRSRNGESAHYCCIGVLGRVVGVPDGLMAGMMRSRLPNRDDGEPYFDGLSLDQLDMLSRMNDNGKTFAQIADYIEANL